MGGIYRYVWRKGEIEMGMRGVYREIVAPERIMTTEVYGQPWYEGEGVGTVTFVEQDHKTTLTITMRYASQEVRDAVLKSPMEQGMGASFDVLADLLTES